MVWSSSGLHRWATRRDAACAACAIAAAFAWQQLPLQRAVLGRQSLCWAAQRGSRSGSLGCVLCSTLQSIEALSRHPRLCALHCSAVHRSTSHPPGSNRPAQCRPECENLPACGDDHQAGEHAHAVDTQAFRDVRGAGFGCRCRCSAMFMVSCRPSCRRLLGEAMTMLPPLAWEHLAICSCGHCCKHRCLGKLSTCLRASACLSATCSMQSQHIVAARLAVCQQLVVVRCKPSKGGLGRACCA